MVGVVEALTVVGTMVVGGGGARGGGVGVRADVTEESVSSTTREEVGERIRVKDNIKNDKQHCY